MTQEVIVNNNKLKLVFQTLNTNYGMIGIIIAMEFAMVLFLGSFSEPMVKIFGKPLLPIDLDNYEISRSGRIIMLYHAFAVPFVGAVALLFLEMYDIRYPFNLQAKYLVFSGSLFSGIGGIVFGYLIPHMFIHTVFLFGLSLSFFGGFMLVLGLFPSKSYQTQDLSEENTIFGYNFEYMNLFLTMLYFIISAAIGGLASSFLGDEPTFLAEDIVRNETHSLLERMVISHLHVMVALLITGIFLMMVTYSEIKGIGYRIIMILAIPGSLLISIGAWLVIVKFEPAHKVINVGAFMLIFGGFILSYHGFKKILAESNEDTVGIKNKSRVLLKDPVKFTLYFELIWGNLVTTIPGIYVGINLDTFRDVNAIGEPYRQIERDFNVAHWHILSALAGLTVCLLLLEHYKIKGKFRDLTGWFFLIGSIVGFGFGALYITRTPETSLTDFYYIMMNIGVMTVFLGVGAFCVAYFKHFAEKIKDHNS
ncbi:MAG: hypothetical protein HeimC2_05790 [Candidatus Heimdallarchaeota archaeon LC_2]|nr:MAG: hypothetical protein HeimC2_05790 [Candidatus Heimdallarchaeota archaeon LC_2]